MGVSCERGTPVMGASYERGAPVTLLPAGWGRTPRVVWLGLRDVQPLVALQQSLASALHDHGVAPSARKVSNFIVKSLINHVISL